MKAKPILISTAISLAAVGGWITTSIPNPVQTQATAQEPKPPDFSLPMTSGRFTSDYGPRTHPVTCEVGRLHKGVDIAAPTGTPILAAADGTVRWAGDAKDGYGNKVILTHPNPAGHETLYAHASTLLVQEGQQVKRGDAIAQVGTTGMSTGPHLHFEVIAYGAAVDPKVYLDFSQFPRVPVATRC